MNQMRAGPVNLSERTKLEIEAGKRAIRHQLMEEKLRGGFNELLIRFYKNKNNNSLNYRYQYTPSTDTYEVILSAFTADGNQFTTVEPLDGFPSDELVTKLMLVM